MDRNAVAQLARIRDARSAYLDVVVDATRQLRGNDTVRAAFVANLEEHCDSLSTAQQELSTFLVRRRTVEHAASQRGKAG